MVKIGSNSCEGNTAPVNPRKYRLNARGGVAGGVESEVGALKCRGQGDAGNDKRLAGTGRSSHHDDGTKTRTVCKNWKGGDDAWRVPVIAVGSPSPI